MKKSGYNLNNESGFQFPAQAEDKPEARDYISNSLRLHQNMSELVPLISSLIGAAGLALHQDYQQFAVKLLGAVDSALKKHKAEMEPEMIHFHAITLAVARERLGESMFQSAWGEGMGWTLEDAADKVLGDA